MEGEYERSLVAWTNTFNHDVTTSASSLAEFSNGELLLPITRTILGETSVVGDSNVSSGWSGVFASLKCAGLIEENAEPPGGAVSLEEKVAVVGTCLEALLRHAVGGNCLLRETFIREIMSLDPDAQVVLSRIIVGQQQQQQCEGYPELFSPERRSAPVDLSFVDKSPAQSVRPKLASTQGRYNRGGCPSVEDLGSGDLSLRSCISSQEEGANGVGPERGAHVGHNIALDGRVNAANLIAVKRLSPAANCSSKRLPATDDECSSTIIANKTADLQTEVAQLKAKLAEAANAQARAVSAIEARHDAAVAREQELNDEVRRARQAAERASCSRENDVIEMEKAMHTSHERQVYVLQERVSRTEERVLDLEPLEEEVIRLRDEVDVLRPTEAKLVKVEENLSRCRARIEELSDLPAQLRREEDAHAEVLDRCLKLETEVTQIPVLRRQLEGYRRSKTEMEMTNREQARALQLSQEEVSRLSREVQTIAEGSGAVRSQHQKLQEELARMAREEAERDGGGGGIGQGMSELNPALSEELARLRRHNEQLAAKLDYNTVETIEDLEHKAEDASRLADSFHANLASERELRAAAEASLADARAHISKLEAEIATLIEENGSTITRFKAEGEAAAAAAAADLAASRKEAQEALATAEEAATGVLEAERRAAAERLAASERYAEGVADGLRREMAGAAEAAAVCAERKREEWSQERVKLEAEIAEAHAAGVRHEERAREDMLGARNAHAREIEEMDEKMERERDKATEREEEAARELVGERQAFERKIAEVKRELNEKLQNVTTSAARNLGEARKQTEREARGRAEEAQWKVEAMGEVARLEEELSSGKRAALSAITQLKANARDMIDESELMHQKSQEGHDAKMAALKAEFDRYCETHTVDDDTYNKDADDWEDNLTLHKKHIADLQRQLGELAKEKRRVEREKTYYWGQAEELRMQTAAGGGSGDSSKEADHAQLVEQANELIEENRELKRLHKELNGAAGSVSTRAGARWGSSGVAAMRAEHESEVNVLKEEKQDLLMKYHATAAKMRQHERRCVELSEEREEMQAQVVALQLTCERQKRKLEEYSAGAVNASASSPCRGAKPASTLKENQPRKTAPKKKSHRREENLGIEIPFKRGEADRDRALLGSSSRESAGVKVSRKEEAVREEGTPPECAQS